MKLPCITGLYITLNILLGSELLQLMYMGFLLNFDASRNAYQVELRSTIYTSYCTHNQTFKTCFIGNVNNDTPHDDLYAT